MNDTVTAPLTITQAVVLGRIALASRGGNRVVRELGDGRIVEGVARSIGDLNGYHAGSQDDIRDMHLRVTTTTGMDTFWAVSELAAELPAGEFCIRD